MFDFFFIFDFNEIFYSIIFWQDKTIRLGHTCEKFQIVGHFWVITGQANFI